MVVMKVLSLVVAAVLSFLAINFVMREMQAVRVKANAKARRTPQVRRLRQDPRTGIYYPEA